jgi:hypothetical protein
MIATAFAPDAETARVADARWVAETADRIVSMMEDSRPTWQMCHVRAEAERQIRTINLPAEQANALFELLVDEVLDYRSIALTTPPDGIEEPEAPQRADVSSVYTVAGADRYTSQRILDAEQRLVAAAGRWDGSVIDPSAVELAMLELAANGTALMPGRRCWSATCVPPACGCSSRSHPPAPGRPSPCAPSPLPGPRMAAR